MSQQELPGFGSILCFAVLLPFLFFWFMTVSVADWQSGNFTDYLSVFFSSEVGVFFVPWYLFAAASALAFDDEPEKSTWVTRLGLLSGVVLSLSYAAAALFRSGGNAPYFLIPILLASAAAGLDRLPWRWTRVSIGALPIAMAAYAIAWTDFALHPGALALVACLCFLLGTPLWASLVYSHLLGRARGWSFLGLTAWFASLAATFALVARKMDDVYAQLPISPPETCYVATAAARGHRAFVGARQLPRLKAAERVLERRVPRGHRAMRAVYDRVGPILARRISHPLLADLAYLSLKFPEALGWVILWWDNSGPRVSSLEGENPLRRRPWHEANAAFRHPPVRVFPAVSTVPEIREPAHTGGKEFASCREDGAS